MPHQYAFGSDVRATSASRVSGSLFTDHQAAIIFKITGIENLDLLVKIIGNCGFDPVLYLSQNEDLRRSGLPAKSAFFHFLRHGVDEQRPAPCGVLLEGLEELRLLAIANHDYGKRLFRSIYHGQLTNPVTVDWLWNAIEGDLILSLRRMGGIPYLVIGDSHTNHYIRPAWFNEQWLAPLPMFCPGRTAISLNGASLSGDGQRILDWAQATVLRHGTDVPIFLKFGGIDSDSLWMRRRIRNSIYQFSTCEFERFAQESVAQYGHFIDRLAAILDSAMLRICSVFPAVLLDEGWVENFAALHRPFFNSDPRYFERLRKSEIPNLLVRTQLRALYNKYLQRLCDQRGLIFVDDFSPLLDTSGVLDGRYRPERNAEDHHVDYGACEEPLVKIIWHFVQ